MTKIANPLVWTAIITPFLETGSIDYESFETLLRRQDEAQNGVVLLGSTGESLALGHSERLEVLKFAIGLGLKSPLMAGVGGINIEEQILWVSELNKLDLNSYLIVTPLYAKPGEEGQYSWFKKLLDESSRPCMLYNVPSRTGIKMNFNAIERLQGHKNFAAIKEASGSSDDFAEYGKRAPCALMYSGDDGLCPEFSKFRFDGVVSVIANVWPKETKKYIELCKEGAYDKLAIWPAVSDSLFIASNPIPAKNLLAEQGLIKSNKMRAPLHEGDLKDNSQLHQSHKKVTQWFKDWS